MADQQAPITDAPEPVQAEGETTTPETPDLSSQLSERFDELKGEIPQIIAQSMAEQQQYYEQQPYEDQYEQQQDPYGGLDPNDPVQSRLLEIQQAQQQQANALEAQRQDMYARDLDGFTSKYPEMNDEKTARPVIDQARFLMQSAGMDPRSMPPIAFLETAFKASRADHYAAQQQPLDQAQNGQASLEQAGAQTLSEPVDEVADWFKPSEPQKNIFGIR